MFPKSSQNRPKIVPTSSQNRPKIVPNKARWAKMAQDGPKMAPKWPQEAEDGPKMAQDVAKNDPRYRQDGPKWPQDGPRWPQDGPRWPQDGPKYAKMILKTAQIGSKMRKNVNKNPKPFHTVKTIWFSWFLLNVELILGVRGSTFALNWLQIGPSGPQVGPKLDR